MAGPLTWRNVEAPDFRSSMEGFRLFSDQLNRAFGTAKDTIGGIQREREDAQSNALLFDLASYTNNPDKLQADLASGALRAKYNPSQLSDEALKALANRPKELLAYASEAANQQHLDWGRRNVVNDDAALRSAAPVLAEFQKLRAAGDDAGAQKILDSNKELISKLHPSVTSGLIKGGLDLARDQAGLTGTRVGNFVTSKRFEWEGTDRQEERDATALTGILRTKAVDGMDVESIVNQNYDSLVKQYGPQVVEAARNRAISSLGGLQTQFDPGAGGGTVGSAGAPGNGTGIGGKNLYDVLLGDTSNGGNSYGFAPPKPVSQMTMGELFNYQRSTMVPATAKAGVGGGKGSSAAGAYQIVSKTLEDAAPEVFGANWRNVQFTPENQDKIAEYLFNNADKTQLHKVWEGLPAGDYRGKTWAEMRGLITSRESGGVANPRAATTAITTAAKHNLSGNLDVETATDFNSAWSDTSVPRDVAGKLAAEGGTFAGEDIGNLTAAIRQVMDEHKVNAAVAGRILARASDGNKGFFGNLVKNSFWGDGLNASIDDDRVRQLGQLAGNRKLLTETVLAGDAQSTGAATVAQAQANLQAAEQALLRKAQAAERRGTKNPNLTVERNNVARARAAFEAAAGQTAGLVAAGGRPEEAPQPRQPAPVRRPGKPSNVATSAIAGAAAGLGGDRNAAWVPPEFRKPFKTPFQR
jgi:hypothetical protein